MSRGDERLKVRVEESTCLTYTGLEDTGLVVELEHLVFLYSLLGCPVY
jgi:hypothetical protein